MVAFVKRVLESGYNFRQCYLLEIEDIDSFLIEYDFWDSFDNFDLDLEICFEDEDEPYEYEFYCFAKEVLEIL